MNHKDTQPTDSQREQQIMADMHELQEMLG
jgi:hypothetical protein